MYGQLIYEKSLFEKWCWELDSHMQNNKIGPLYYAKHTHTKNKINGRFQFKAYNHETSRRKPKWYIS